MNLLRSLLFTVEGRISKSKATALVALILTALHTFGVVDWTEEERGIVAAALLSLWGIFFRSALDEK